MAHRLHPATLVFSFGKVLRSLLIPAALALFSGRGSFFEALFIVMFVLTATRAIIRYFTLTWRLDETELVVKEGVFRKSERHVPYARIQNVDLVQNVFHRLFRVAEVRVETASGSEPEAVLSVLALNDVEALRARIFHEREVAHDAAAASDHPAPGPLVDEGEVLVRVPPRQLVFLGLVMNRGMAVVAAGFGLLYEFGAIEKAVQGLGLDRWFTRLVAAGWFGALLQLALVISVVLVVLFGLSIVWSLVRFWGFTLRAKGEDLRLACGLLTRVQASVPRQRIQSLTIKASWLHRRFGLSSIKAQTAGGTADEKGTAALVRTRFVPVLPTADVPRVIEAVMPRVRLEAPTWQGIAPSAIRRIRRRSVLGIGIPAVALAVFVSPYTLLATVPLLGIAWWYAGAAVRRARFARTSWGLVWERGVFTRETTFLPADKVQTLRRTTSPFDRRHGHVTLLVDAAGGSQASPEVRIRYLDAAVASTLYADLAGAAAATEYGLEPGSRPPRRNPARAMARSR